jgi:nucleoid-associated protein YgaU
VRQYRTQPRPTQHRDATRTVVVQPGDSLWRIAAEHLPGHPTPKRIARAWPRWYAANRAVIGDDPNLIVPGQHLHTPPERPAP